MENQHKKIKGYRDLTEAEIALMNEIKEHGEKTKNLIAKVKQTTKGQFDEGSLNMQEFVDCLSTLTTATEYLSTGQMWLVRVVARPEGF